jgi:hypothetical protein
MYLKLQSGRYAGEIRDVRVDQAREMLADGRAVVPVLAEDGVSGVPAMLLSERGGETIVPAKRSRIRRRG